MGKLRKNQTQKQAPQQNINVSRRDFLKNAGLFTGGVAITSMAIATGCGPDTDNNDTPRTTPATTSPPSPTPTDTQPHTTTPPPTTPPANVEFKYVPSREFDVVEIEGCYTIVAGGRLYTFDHMWVKQLEGNKAVIGVTDKMQALMDIVEEMSLPRPGEKVAFDSRFGYAEGAKLNAELYSPVSGTVIQINNELTVPPYNYFEMVNKSPYIDGWLFVVELSNPAELDELLTAEEYAYLQRIGEEEARDRGLIP